MLLAAALLTLCAPDPRDNCVHDGDTFWLAGEKYRITDIDTPEISQPKCRAEYELGIRARDRLLVLLNEGPFELVRSGRDRDRNGRLLRVVTRKGGRLAISWCARSWRGPGMASADLGANRRRLNMYVTYTVIRDGEETRYEPRLVKPDDMAKMMRHAARSASRYQVKARLSPRLDA